jgi:hypothetical protein
MYASIRTVSTKKCLGSDVVSKAVDDGEAVDIFYLDFAKAFDKVPRQKINGKAEG